MWAEPCELSTLSGKGALLAPHGKTTLSPELMRMQLTGGAWGLTLANVHQVQVGIEAGAKNIIIANQVVALADLDGLDALRCAHLGVRPVAARTVHRRPRCAGRFAPLHPV